MDSDRQDNAGEPQDKSNAAGLSAFLGKVFGQLSLSAWLPAAMLVGNVAVLLQLHTDRNLNVASAIDNLVGKPLGIVIVVVFAVVLAAIVIQAFEFETIRLMEGYRDSSNGVFQALAAVRIQRYVSKRKKLEKKRDRATQNAFMQARRAMLEVEGAYDRGQLDIIEDEIFHRPRPPATDKEILNRAMTINWAQHASAAALYRVDALRAQLNDFPDPDRILPTRLGNILRAAEDRLRLLRETNQGLETFVIRYYDQLPTTLRSQHNHYRTRLEMYCSLILVFLALAVTAAASLGNVQPAWGGILATTAYLGMAQVSYEAAATSARHYGEILGEIGEYVKAKHSSLLACETHVSSQWPCFCDINNVR